MENHLERSLAVNEELRRRNGRLLSIVQEVAPDRIDDMGRIILPTGERTSKSGSIEAPKQAYRVEGDRRFSTCIECGGEWSEPRRKGRMNSRCPAHRPT